ncbi:MAG: DUF5684 domain-containing protein [Omnitrophica bacterium]|nr:DUF5684 domain-containing protein [Candidatus Omnitrophota bacterium]
MSKNKLIVIFLVGFSLICLSISFAQPNVKVNGVLLGREKTAIINGNIKREGDFVDGAKVMEITEAYVKFKYQDNTFIVRLGRDILESPRELQFDTQKIQVSRKKFKFDNNPFQKGFPDVVQKDMVSFFSKMGSGAIIIVSILAIVFYIFFSYTLQKIASKTNTKNGWFAWVPIFNTILHCDIAQKPRWWAAVILVALFIPLIGGIIFLVFYIVIWMKIAQRRNRPAWLGILVLVPFLGLVFVQAYFAFSDSKLQLASSSEETPPSGGTQPQV